MIIDDPRFGGRHWKRRFKSKMKDIKDPRDPRDPRDLEDGSPIGEVLYVV